MLEQIIRQERTLIMRGETNTHLAITTRKDNKFIRRGQLFSSHELGLFEQEYL